MRIYDKFSMQAAIRLLNKWTAAYEQGKSIVSDREWDDLYFELQDAERRFGIIMENSPTQKIIYQVVNELKKVKHEYQPMLSLDKTKDIEEVKDFIDNKEWIAMLKLDGLTCRLTYENGKLVRAETRGDGIEGEDITHNAMVLPSVPKRIPYKDTFIVDGEVICDLKTFEQFKNDYANARNFAAGSIRLLDSGECAKRELTFVAWDVITGYEDEDIRLNQKLAVLIDYNFTTVPFTIMDFDNCIEWLKSNNEELTHYPIDGIVFKYNKNSEYQAAGRTDHHFRGGLAYKFYDEEYKTILRDIEWTMGRTGTLTPVAIYDDVEIDGAICNRASLHNVNTMINLLGQPFKKQVLWIYKANQIIPQVSRAEHPDKIAVDFTFQIPEFCPICGAPAILKSNGAETIELYCSNDSCEGKLVNRLDHFCGKKGLDIKGLSKATLEKLIEWGWVSTIVDIFLLRGYRDQWIKKSGFGEKSVDRILTAIDNARKPSLSSYIAALGIPLIGRTVARDICNYVDSYWEFRELINNNFDFCEWAGFGPEKRDRLLNYDYLYADYLIDHDMVQIEQAVAAPTRNALEGKVFVVTGKLKTFKNRDEIKSRIEALGGKVTEAISSKTNYLINNDVNSTSAKNKKAKELNIPVITEEEFLNMLN